MEMEFNRYFLRAYPLAVETRIGVERLADGSRDECNLKWLRPEALSIFI